MRRKRRAAEKSRWPSDHYLGHTESRRERCSINPPTEAGSMPVPKRTAVREVVGFVRRARIRLFGLRLSFRVFRFCRLERTIPLTHATLRGYRGSISVQRARNRVGDRRGARGARPWIDLGAGAMKSRGLWRRSTKTSKIQGIWSHAEAQRRGERQFHCVSAPLREDLRIGDFRAFGPSPASKSKRRIMVARGRIPLRGAANASTGNRGVPASSHLRWDSRADLC